MKIGDNVVYHPVIVRKRDQYMRLLNGQYKSTQLKDFQICEIFQIVEFNKRPDILTYDEVRDTGVFCWICIDDFITQQEYRKLKLEKLNENRR